MKLTQSVEYLIPNFPAHLGEMDVDCITQDLETLTNHKADKIQAKVKARENIRNLAANLDYTEIYHVFSEDYMLDVMKFEINELKEINATLADIEEFEESLHDDADYQEYTEIQSKTA